MHIHPAVRHDDALIPCSFIALCRASSLYSAAPVGRLSASRKPSEVPKPAGRVDFPHCDAKVETAFPAASLRRHSSARSRFYPASAWIGAVAPQSGVLLCPSRLARYNRTGCQASLRALCRFRQFQAVTPRRFSVLRLSSRSAFRIHLQFFALLLPAAATKKRNKGFRASPFPSPKTYRDSPTRKSVNPTARRICRSFPPCAEKPSHLRS